MSNPSLDAIAARAEDGHIWLAITNIDPVRAAQIETSAAGASTANGETLTAPAIDSVNSFDAPDIVRPTPFSAHAANGRLMLTLPPRSVTVVRLDP